MWTHTPSENEAITSNAQIRAESVGIRFAGHPPVLDAASFSVCAGQFVSIVGPSGCGKTTVLRLVAGLTEPTSGRLSIDVGVRTAFVFQEPNLLPWRNVAANIRLPLELHDVATGERERAVRESLALIGLNDADRSKFPRMLSGGMKMRVSLARALVTEPDVLLLDEPFAALDDMLRQQLNDQLLGIWRRQEWTALFVTHNVAEAVFLSQRILIMSGRPGTIAATVDVPFAYPRPYALRGEAEFARFTEDVSQQIRRANS